MATSNFCYDNRCVVVTNEDYECGNHPQLDEFRCEPLHTYPSCKLAGYNFHFWEIVLTSGHYEHACIDYVEKTGSRSVYHYINPGNYSSVREFCDDVYFEFKDKISRYKIRKIFSGFRSSGKELYDFLEDKFNECVEYAADVERKKVEAAIDKIKADYGYEEYCVYARLSNGETWYSKVS